MKIVLLSNMYPSAEHPAYGIFVRNFEMNMATEGFAIEKAIIEGRGKTFVQKISKYFRYFKDAVHVIKSTDCEAIYIHYIGHSLLPLFRVKGHIRCPLILNAHGSDVMATGRFGPLLQRIVKPLVRKCDLLVVPSPSFVETVEQRYGVERERIFISPSGGIDTGHFKPMAISKDRSVCTIGYVSRIDDGKGWDIALEALRKLIDQGFTDIRMLLLGGGAQEGLLRQKIQELDLQTHVDVRGPVAHSDLPMYYNQMDLFLFPTRLNESLGLVGLEAMACGLPVVGSDIGGLKGYIRNGYNGERFPVGDSSHLSKVVEKFICMKKDSFEKYRVNALQTARMYDSKLVAKSLAEKIKSVVSHS